jgi:hypothetical protein
MRMSRVLIAALAVVIGGLVFDAGAGAVRYFQRAVRIVILTRPAAPTPSVACLRISSAANGQPAGGRSKTSVARRAMSERQVFWRGA